MAVNDQSPMRGRRTLPRSAGGYEPVRKPKLRAPVVTQPPPLPEAPREAHSSAFGEAEEDGLRMLVALETMESLEPDFCGDLVTEASVTIIERAEMTATPDEEEPELPPAGSLRARLGGIREASDIDPDEHAAYLSEVEEAIVEIIEVVPSQAAVPAAAEISAPLPGRLKKAHQAHRFLKALVGGDDD